MSRALLLVFVVLGCMILTALQALHSPTQKSVRKDMFTDPSIVQSTGPTVDNASASVILPTTTAPVTSIDSTTLPASGVPTMGLSSISESADLPPRDAQIINNETLHDTPYNQDSGYLSDASTMGDPLFRLLSALALENTLQDTRNILERAPALPQVSDEMPYQSASTQQVSTDQPLRQYLDKASEAVTNWKELAEHALRERDMYKRHSEADLPAFTSNDLVLDHTQRWSVPQHRPPVCIVNERRASKVCSTTDQSSLIGTLLSDAQDTSVGSIMPKFAFHLID